MATFAEGFNSLLDNWLIEGGGDYWDTSDYYEYIPEGDYRRNGVFHDIGDIIGVIDLTQDGTGTHTFTLDNGNYAEFHFTNHYTGGAWGGIEWDIKLYEPNPEDPDNPVELGASAGYYSTANLTLGEYNQWVGEAGTGARLTFYNRYVENLNDSSKFDFEYGFCLIAPHVAEGVSYPIAGVPNPLDDDGVLPQHVKMSVDIATTEAETQETSARATNFLRWINGATEPKNEGGEDTEAGEEGTPAGGFTGGISWGSDGTVLPSLPSISLANCGIAGIYKVTAPQLASLSSFMWDNNFFTNIVKNMASPMENIIMFGIVPFTNFSTSAGNIVIGNVDTGISAMRLNTTFYELNCGTLHISEEYFSYADYEPYTKFWLFLPYIGFVDLPKDDVAKGGDLNVIYRFDVFSGACVAYLNCYSPKTKKWDILQAYEGNILTTLPITGANYTGMYAQLANALIGAAANIASENYAGLIGNAVQASTAKPQYMRSGGVSNVAGLMGVQHPYIVKAIPQVFQANTFKNHHGYISNLTVTINNQTGYVRGRINNTQLSNIAGATQTELDEIKNIIASGIFI